MSFLTGCTQNQKEKHPDTVRVKIPWFSGQSYQLRTIELISITDMVTLKGWAARFLLSPGVSDQQLVGLEPRIHTLRNSEGVYIPTDYLSTELLSLYAHFEKLAQMDIDIGTGSYIENWPRVRTIAVDVKQIDSQGQLQKDNARFSGDLDAFLFVPYTMSDLPFSVNAGVIGHEHFHSLFYNILIKPLGASYPDSAHATVHQMSDLEKDLIQKIAQAKRGGSQIQSGSTSGNPTLDLNERDNYHRFLLRGLNEGLADVWGWLYSGDTSFVEKSASQFSMRNLDLPSFGVLSVDGIKELSSSPTETENLVYYVGISYARMVYSSFQEMKKENTMSEIEAKKELSQALLRSLVRLKSEYIKLKTDELLVPQKPLDLLTDELPRLKTYIEKNK